MTVEVDTGSDSRTPLSALYNYLWERGTLADVSVPIPSKTIGGNSKCKNVACMVESVRDLLPQTNALMESLVCKMNANMCSGGKIRSLPEGSMLILPDVPFEPYLGSAPQTFDGKTPVSTRLRQLIGDDSLLFSVSSHDLDELNPATHINLGMIPAKGMTLQLPVQRNRYYLSVERSEVYSADSELSSLARKSPLLGLRPYGSSSGAAGQAAAPPDLTVHNAADLAQIQTGL